jgi:hypothetical protein
MADQFHAVRWLALLGSHGGSHGNTWTLQAIETPEQLAQRLKLDFVDRLLFESRPDTSLLPQRTP